MRSPKEEFRTLDYWKKWRTVADRGWGRAGPADGVLKLLEQEAISRAKALELLEEIARTGKRPESAPWGELNWHDDGTRCGRVKCRVCDELVYTCEIDCPKDHHCGVEVSDGWVCSP